MKKVVLLFILFVFSLSQADAQEFHFIPLEFGKYLSGKFCGYASGVKYWCGGGNTF